MTEKIHKLIIVGSGPAGLTAGIYAARAHLQPLIIEGKNPGGQLINTTLVENWPGEKSIMGPQLMVNMKAQAQHQGSLFYSGEIVEVNFADRPFKLITNKKETLYAQAIILATGAVSKKLGCKGEDKYWGKGVTTCAVCDGPLYKDKPVIIVGGGDTAMEDASFMLNFTDDITIIQILDHITASEAMKQRVINNPKIKIIYESTVEEMKGDNERLSSVIIHNKKTGQKKEVKTEGLFLAVGLIPNTGFLKGHVKLDDWGYLVLHDQTKTSVPGVFGAGDVHDFKYRQAVTSAGAGCMAALDAERYLKSL